MSSLSSAPSPRRRDGHGSDLAALRTLWVVTGPVRHKVVRGIAFRFLQSMALGLAFGVMIWVVTGLGEGRPMTAAWAWQATGLMALSLVGQTILGYLSARESWTAGYALAGELRLALLERLRRLPMGFHLSRHSGDTVTVLTSDMQMIEVFLSDSLPRIAQGLGLPLVIFAFLMWRDPVTALAAVSVVAAAVPLFLASSRRLAALGLERQDLQAAAAGRMIEYVLGMKVFRAFNLLRAGTERFDAALEDLRDVSVRMVTRLIVPVVACAALVMCGVPLVMLVAGLRFLSGAMDAGTLITLLVLTTTMYAPLLALVGVMETARIAEASLARMERIMNDRPLPAPRQPRPPAGFALEFEGVDFAYQPGVPVLRSVSFRVPERAMVAIVGSSGSGKSTILSLAARFWDADHGSVRIGGVDVREMDPATRNGLVTAVFQDVYLFAGTIFDNIALGRPGADRRAVEEAARAAQAHDFIAALPLGYDTPVGEGGACLSGGERQRISIARAILKDAPLILLDEATAAIDPTNERAIQMALRRLVADRSLLVVAHKLSTIRAADRILVVEAGRVVESGTHAELMARSGRYARLWARRSQAARWHLAAPSDTGVAVE